MIAQIMTDIGGGAFSSFNKTTLQEERELVHNAVLSSLEYIEHVYKKNIEIVDFKSHSIKFNIKNNKRIKSFFSKNITSQYIYEDLRKFIKNSRRFKNNILISTKDNEIFFKYEESDKVNLSNKLSDF